MTGEQLAAVAIIVLGLTVAALAAGMVAAVAALAITIIRRKP